MSHHAIEIRGLSKRYRLGATASLDQSFREMVYERLGRCVRRGRGGAPSQTDDREFWALRDVSFDVARGEVIGVIGRNGAGKSTLLKILSRITDPTEGEARIRGRVASLLEVGSGFHPELTGRENIYLNGAILGMTSAEVRRKFDEIVDFAGIERFLDTPVKRYSSGMYVRLAFAVAAHLTSEVLIVDEVLAVGDAAFQAKCLGRMKSAARDGRTVLFVSHHLDSVQALCPRSLLIDGGRLSLDASTDQVIDAHLRRRSQHGDQNGYVRPDHDRRPDRSVEFDSLTLTPAPADCGGRDIECVLRYRVQAPRVGCVIALVLTNARGVAATQTIDTDTTPDAFEKRRGEYVAQLRLPASMLVPGEYYVTLSAADMKGTRFDFIPDAASFTVTSNRRVGNTFHRHGLIALGIPWSVSSVPHMRKAG